jgi:lipooligosaccharide transport system permease protein
MGSAYNLFEFIMLGQVSSWMSANVSPIRILGAHTLLQCFRSVISVTSILLGAWILVPTLPIHSLLSIYGILLLLSVLTTLWGSIIAMKAESINEIYLSDTLIYAVFVFSGIFVATNLFPAPVQWVMAALPFWNAVELVRPLFMGEALPANAPWHLGVLCLYLAVGYAWATRAFYRKVID